VSDTWLEVVQWNGEGRMSQEFSDTINDLLTEIWSKKEEGIISHECEIYLRSACQKQLFAEKRAEAIKKDIIDYQSDQKVRDSIGTLQIEMDFDHCIISLRSSIEHLAQLINAIVGMGLSPTRKQGSNTVDLYKVRDALLKSTDANLSGLGGLLKDLTDQDWHNDLNDLRITLFHHKFERLPRSYAVNMTTSFSGIDFRLPEGTCPNISQPEDRLIDSFCNVLVSRVQSLLFKSYRYLIEYLHSNST